MLFLTTSKSHLVAIGTNCHNYCNSKSEQWLAVEIAIASQTETAFAEQPGEGACVFVLGLDFICVFYPSSFLRILKNNFFPPGTLEEIKRLVLRVARSPLINVPITSPPSASTALRSVLFLPLLVNMISFNSHTKFCM